MSNSSELYDIGFDTHYGVIYHVHYPYQLQSYINITMQIIFIKGTT